MHYNVELAHNNERGVLFYIASDIHVKVIDNSSARQECILLLLKGRGGNSHHNQILLGNIYRSPNSTQDNDNELYKMFKDIQRTYKIPKLLVGDFNFASIKWNATSRFGATAMCSNFSDNELCFVNALRENLFYQHVVYPTRQWGSDHPHILDLLYQLIISCLILNTKVHLV